MTLGAWTRVSIQWQQRQPDRTQAFLLVFYWQLSKKRNESRDLSLDLLLYRLQFDSQSYDAPFTAANFGEIFYLFFTFAYRNSTSRSRLLPEALCHEKLTTSIRPRQAVSTHQGSTSTLQLLPHVNYRKEHCSGVYRATHNRELDI